MSLKLPRFEQSTELVDKDGLPTVTFHRWWAAVADALEQAFNDLSNSVAAIAAAQAAADLANAAAAAADAAATSAQTTADGIADGDSLAKSWITGTPPIVSATDAGADVTVAIATHTRKYPQPDGTTVNVSVTGASITGLAYTTFYYIYYDDPTRAGGAVTYHATTSKDTAAQVGNRHSVGAVVTPAAAGAPESGGYTGPPGSGQFPEP